MPGTGLLAKEPEATMACILFQKNILDDRPKRHFTDKASRPKVESRGVKTAASLTIEKLNVKINI